MRKQQGFTLIELMVTVMIVGILAAIAIPSYQRYVVKNAEDEAKSQLGQLELQLANWRASALSYRGFTPINGADANGPTYGYAAGTATPNTILYIPLGSTDQNFRYQIEIVDGNSRLRNANGVSIPATSLLPPNGGTAATVNSALGRSYILVAYPNSRLEAQGARKFLVHSNGARCSATPANFNNLQLNARDCSATGVETWQ